jgi:hypothetical protein
MRRWCAAAGVRPAPRSVAALARGVGLHREQTWRVITGQRWPSLPMLRRLSCELRVSLEAVATACEQALEDQRRRLDVERARLRAERRD